jgi:tetratricopeptide (TPR) repeat protein
LFTRQLVYLFIATLSCFSCVDYLDIRPESQLLQEEFWQNESDVEAMLMACYRTMQEDDFMWRVITWGELRSDNMVAGGGNVSDDERQMDNANILPTNGLAQWTAFYRLINYCNTILKYAPQVMETDPNFTNADLQAKSAEALALRALSYFYLVRTFRDVPLMLDATVDDTQVLQIPQSTPDRVLAKITDDLLQAEEWAMLGFTFESEDKGRMTKDVIRAILADVYLWRKDYAKSVEYCDKLINAKSVSDRITGMNVELPKYSLIEDYDLLYEIFYPGNSTESIFELQFTTEKNNEAVAKLYGNTTTNVGRLIATTVYAEGVECFGKTDTRKADFICMSKTDDGVYGIFKYLGIHQALGINHLYVYDSSTATWIFYRITDVMLMKAEALVQLNRSDDDLREALRIVNTTYMRANPTLLETDTLAFDTYGNVNNMEKLVLRERQRELMFEGKRWFDLLRHAERKNSTEDLVNHVVLKYTVNQSTIASKLSVMNALYMPIHADELKVNALLIQNPYYQSSTNIEKQ